MDNGQISLTGKMVVIEDPHNGGQNALTNPDKDLFRLKIANDALKYVIFGTGIIMLLTLAADVFLAGPTGQVPDIADHVSRVGGLTIPLISFILGHIFGKSQG
jgi:hypothetical protein